MNTGASIRRTLRACPTVALLLLLAAARGAADPPKAKAPEIGYICPAGGAAGTTVNVELGGFEWTPDMQLFVHRPGVQLVATGPPGPVLVPDPPYWLGPKSFNSDPLLPSETPARITIPADCPPGPIFWQAANANGSTATGVFIVSAGSPAGAAEVLEIQNHKSPQPLKSLPVTVSGRITRIEEVDRYEFTAAREGPVTCVVDARRLGSQLLAALEVRDAAGLLVADAYDTEGTDAALTFAAEKDATYFISIRDIDFRGDRSYGYRLTIVEGPRVLAALPSGGRRGQTRSVEFIGIGVATGQRRIESVKRDVAFPNSAERSFEYRLETPFGQAPAFSLQLSDVEETVEPEQAAGAACPIGVPAAVTGTLKVVAGEDRYTCQGKKGDVWAIALCAREIGSPLDPVLVIRDAAGKELARADDSPNTPDCQLLFTAPADGAYTLAVGDLSGKSGLRTSTYRLVVEQPKPDFSLQSTVQHVSMMLGEKAPLTINATRRGGFKEPIALAITGLPEGVAAVGELLIPADKNQVTVSLQSSADGAAIASMVRIIGTAKIGDDAVTRPVRAAATGNLCPRTAKDRLASALVVANTIKPVCSVEPLEKDGGRTVHRGTTFPAQMVITRTEGFTGEVVMRMASVQSRHRQGINGHDVVVPPGETRAIYPCTMPEWLETSRTSRMAVVGVAQVADPRGNLRYSVSAVQGQVTMTIEGALLKITCESRELRALAGQSLAVPLKISRSERLTEPALVELVLDDDLRDQFQAQPITLPAGQTAAVFHVDVRPGSQRPGRYTLAIRATVMQDGRWPVISETNAPVEIVAGK
jgi:hypothetical protein